MLLVYRNEFDYRHITICPSFPGEKHLSFEYCLKLAML